MRIRLQILKNSYPRLGSWSGIILTMSGINEMIRKMESVKIADVVEESLFAIQDKLVKLQRLQLLMGQRADGKKIGKYKDPHYAVRKFQLNPLAGFGFMDWRVTGALHGGVFAEVRESSVVFYSTDSKTNALTERLGDPFGLNKANTGEATKNYLQPEALRRIKEKAL